MKGIDISEYQTNVDYKKLKEDGYEFVFIRCGYGKNASQKDEMFETHYAGCREAGLKVGCYHYSYADTIEGSNLEAENCLSFIKGKQFDLPVFYDVEDDETTGQTDKYTLTQMCKTFCNRLMAAGYKAGIYANLNWFNNKMYVEELQNNYYIWLAQWNDTMDAHFNVNFWQYGKGNVNGISGEVDFDELLNYEIPHYETTGIYQNGSTKEYVFADTDLKCYVGCLAAKEKCECLGIYKNRAIVRYHVDGSINNYKIRFCKMARWCSIMDFCFGLIIGVICGAFFVLLLLGEKGNGGSHDQ